MPNRYVPLTVDALPSALYAHRDNEEGVLPLQSDSNGALKVVGENITQIYAAISAIRAAVGTAADLRVTLLSGVVTTVTTVTTVTGITNLGGNPAINVVPNLANINHVLSNLNNIGA